MKHRRNVASNVPSKALLSLGKDHYFFTSSVLGPCIAIMFPDQNPPRPAKPEDKADDRCQSDD